MLGEATTSTMSGEPMVIVPLGATEQHGPHLPLDTDTRIATAWAQRLAAALDPDASGAVRVAPTLAYGASGEHQGFAGTMSIGNDAMVQVLVQLGRSIRDWAGPLVLLSGHAGNYDSLQRAAEQLRAEGDRVTVLIPILRGGDAHAGKTETSILLHLFPELVRFDLAEPGRVEPIGELIHDLRRVGVKGVSANGVLGDPAGASAAEGADLLDQLVQHAVDEIAAAQF